ncbi:MAG: hypothetical protein AMXMBFR56_29300 [Polyangiaceae bacterium]
MTRTARGDLCKTEGQRLLSLVSLSAARVAAAVGCSRQAVLQWRQGVTTPAHEHRRALELELGIPARAWALRPGAELEAPPPVVPAPASAAVEGDGEELLEQVRRARREPGISSAELARLAAIELKILEQRSEAEKLLASPAWGSLVDFLFGTVEGHALALDALMLAVLRLEGSPRLAPIEAEIAKHRADHAELVAAAEQANAALLELGFWRPRA